MKCQFEINTEKRAIPDSGFQASDRVKVLNRWQRTKKCLGGEKVGERGGEKVGGFYTCLDMSVVWAILFGEGGESK